MAGMDVSTAVRLGATVNVDSAGVISSGGDIMLLDQIKANPITPNPPRIPATQIHLLKPLRCRCRGIRTGAVVTFFSGWRVFCSVAFSLIARSGVWELLERRKVSCLAERSALAFSRTVSSC